MLSRLHFAGLASIAISVASTLAQSGKIERSDASKAFVLQRGWHHEILGLVTTNISENGSSLIVTNELVNLATGLNYQDTTGKLVPSEEIIEIVEGAAVAWRGQHKVSIAWNANLAEAVILRMPDDAIISSHVYGLAYYDPDTGQAALIGNVKDTQGLLVGRNQVLYPDAFEGILSDIRYTYTMGGFEQDIILREDLPPLPDGFGPKTRVEVWTEFGQGPEPQKTVSAIEESDQGTTQLLDETLDFGQMRIGDGRTFRMGSEEDTLSVVAKQWVKFPDGRRFLIESIAINGIRDGLNSLPPSGKGGAGVHRRYSSRLQALLSAPSKGHDQALRKSGRIRRLGHSGAEVAALSRPGLVLDWVIHNTSQTNMVFKGHQTYWITGPVGLYGTNTVFEGGTVIKFTNNVANLKLTVNTPIVWSGSMYQPVVLTAQNDHSVGEKIGSGTLSGYYATAALCLDAATNAVANFQFAHLRIANAQTAIELKQKSGHVFSHLQIVNCQYGIAAANADYSLRNALFHNVGTVFGGGIAIGSTVRAEHLTINTASLLYGTTTLNQLYLTNCLIAGVTSLGAGAVTVTNQVAVLSSTSGLFQTVKAGNNYLAPGSPYRNAGTLAINPKLAWDFAEMTTFPPLELSGNITTDTTLGVAIPRDTDLPDLGYHYYALDYIWSQRSVTGANLRLLSGVAVAAYGNYCVYLTSGGDLTSIGLPHRLNRLVRYEAVQEQPAVMGTNSGDYRIVDFGNSSCVADLRFTDIPFQAQSDFRRQLIKPYDRNVTLAIRDSAIRSAVLDVGGSEPSGSGFVGQFINNIWNNCQLNLEEAQEFSLVMRNNLFLSGSTSFYYSSSGPAWTINNNLFAGMSLSGASGVPGLRNAFTTGTVLLGSATGNITNRLADFVPGVLGSYYYPASGASNSLASLRDAETATSAAGAGMAQYTTGVEQSKDTGNLDIGFHYVATAAHLASTGFSSIQGSNGWWYMYGPLKMPASGFMGFTETNTAVYWRNWTSGTDWRNQYCLLYAGSQHPGMDYDSIRAFAPPKTGRIRISGTASDIGGSCGGNDGIDAGIWLNGALLTGWNNVPNNGSRVMDVFSYARVGDGVYFQVNGLTDSSCDNTSWDPLVAYDLPLDSDNDGVADYFEDSNGDGVQNASDGSTDTDGDGVIDRLDRNPLDPTLSSFLITIESPVQGSTIN